MASSSKSHLCVVIILSLAFFAQSKWNLEPSESEALQQLKEDLGITSQRDSDHNPCSSSGISCERRVYGNSSEIRVVRIVFKSQGLDGFLSPDIGRLSELKELSLPDNRLLDGIPPELGNCRKLEILNLQKNGFSGEIPSELKSLIALRIIDLSSNRFEGDLGFLKHFRNLESLSLSDNLFVGKVPPSLKSFRNLKFVNLTGNKLQGYLAPASLLKVDYSKNSLPRRYKLAETSNSTNSNNQTAAVPPSPGSSGNHSLNNQTSDANRTSGGNQSASAPGPSPADHKKHKRRHVKSWIIGFVVGAITGVLSGAVFSVIFRILLNCIRGRGKNSGLEIYSSLIKNADDLAFLEKEDGLASLEIIGRGGCGEVYRAELPGSNGKQIAIKKVIQPATDGPDLSEEDSKLLNKRMRQIKSEIQTVGHIRHRNLLPLLAHVPRPDCHYLVYEFMKNGSLQDVLKQVSEGTRELDWPTRHNIAMGIAAGLEYLHMNHNPRIIHRDLKPGNILLDDNLEARIADFGLAKAVPDANTHVSTSNIAGTAGFIAPEYYQILKFTDKCDIYSFGVVLVVLVMGKLPSDEFFQTTEEMSLVKWLRNVMASENPSKAIDPKLMGHGFDAQMLLVLKIACFCTMDDPKQRPNSKDVRCMLSQLKN
ncbi:leucine-rich repeat receptor-like serine/threonine/tyrosine-protein kinase SOBIR1 [Magnolia sinica]|uniref:leucine-rich repeat receptor-like serine/threonine/tyrosine-protein kinase SOBIR1 n=1 Tax=Magnolia sinica TaxID=86752 RepID=UPI00265B4DBB|nr:leucine-rich repeat receptor-like serine/threonine/tyrosine-protein kinase SOBIR1 [Magnolia sinica]